MKKSLLTLTLLGCLSTSAFAKAPVINLIPVTAQEHIKESSRAAVEMRSALSSVFEDIEMQKSLWDAAKCDGMLDDPGCRQIQAKLRGSYKEMLQHLDEKLPELNETLEITAKSIEQRLYKELGKKKTLMQIQEMLLGSGADGKRQLQARTSNNSHNMLHLLREMSKAISSGGYAEAEALVASDIYINMTLATETISTMQAEINQTLATIDTYNAFDGLTDNQLKTVASVKSLLFGDVESDMLPSMPEPDTQAHTSVLDSDW